MGFEATLASKGQDSASFWGSQDYEEEKIGL